MLNRLPTKSVEGKTPIEAWSEVKPSARHLKIFDSVCYAHIPSVKRGKLDQKVQLEIFLGYVVMSKGYRVFNLSTQKITVSRNVIVDENTYWN